MKNTLSTGTELAQQLAAARRRLAELERANQALRESEEKYSRIFFRCQVGISLIRMSDVVITDVNDAFSTFAGYTRDDVIGREVTNPNIWVNPEDRERMVKMYKKKVRVTNEEYHARTKSGKTHVIVISTEPVEIRGEWYQIAVARDITECKQAEEEIRVFSQAVAGAIDGIAITDMKGIITYVNPAMEETYGYNQGEMLGKLVVTLSPNPEIANEIMSTMLKTGSWHGEIEVIKKNKEIFPVLLSLSTVTDDKGNPMAMMGAVRDISERRQRELALQESEEKFSKVFNFSANAICITSIKDERIIDVNESFARFTGYSREEIIGRTGEELNLWADDEQRKLLLESMSKGDYFVNLEFRSRTKSGEIRTGLVSDEVISIGGEPCRIGVITDITERKKAETALQDEATRRRILVDQSRDGIVILDQEGHVYEANQRFADMLGYSTEEVRHLSVFDWEYSYPRDTVIEMLRTVDESGDHFETSHRRKDGSIYDVEISTNGAIFAGQKLIFCVCRDITERKQAEEKLQHTLAHLEKSSARLEAANNELEAFSYSVSHDLRSPLRSIDGFSQALLEDYTDKLDETGRDYLGRLRGASQKMGELIDGLLKLSRLSRSEMHREEVDLSALSQEIVSRLRETEPEREAEVSISPGLTASGDPQLLRALLENLLGNAWKFTGKVPRARIEFGALRNGEHQTFFVRDNGAGFDMSYADKLFGAFQRLHDVSDFPGTGIGLATVRRIVNRHGGTIWAEAKVGKGAIFYFTLE